MSENIRRSASLTNWLLTTGIDGFENVNTLPHDFAETSAPKTVFMFTVEFEFRDSIANTGNKELNKIEYDLKSVSRPNISFEHQDLNFYNYRAKINTKVNFGQLKMSMFEDNRGTSSDLTWALVHHISPVTNEPVAISTDSGVGVEPLYNGRRSLQGGGVGTMQYADGPIKGIRLYHYYRKQDGSVWRTVYTYTNPLLERIEFTELNMSSNEPSIINLTFNVFSCSTTEEKVG